MFESAKKLRLLKSEVELDDDENESKKATDENKIFFFRFQLEVKRNSYKPNSLIGLSWSYFRLVFGKHLRSISVGYMAHNNKKKHKHRKITKKESMAR